MPNDSDGSGYKKNHISLANRVDYHHRVHNSGRAICQSFGGRRTNITRNSRKTTEEPVNPVVSIPPALSINSSMPFL